MEHPCGCLAIKGICLFTTSSTTSSSPRAPAGSLLLFRTYLTPPPKGNCCYSCSSSHSNWDSLALLKTMLCLQAEVFQDTQSSNAERKCHWFIIHRSCHRVPGTQTTQTFPPSSHLSRRGAGASPVSGTDVLNTTSPPCWGCRQEEHQEQPWEGPVTHLSHVSSHLLCNCGKTPSSDSPEPAERPLLMPGGDIEGKS